MPRSIFELKSPDLINLIKLFKRAPDKFSRGVSNVLNTLAFGARRESLNVIKKAMTVRNQKFVDSRVRVVKAKPTGPIEQKQSEYGSIKSPRFSGWVEQEKGTPAKRTRVATILARGNRESGKVQGTARLKPGRNLKSPDEFEGKSKRHRALNMLERLQGEGFKKPFIITGLKIAKGVYRFIRGKLRRLQNFETKKAQPKRFKWMTIANRDYMASVDITDVWERTLKHIFKKK